IVAAKPGCDKSRTQEPQKRYEHGITKIRRETISPPAVLNSYWFHASPDLQLLCDAFYVPLLRQRCYQALDLFLVVVEVWADAQEPAPCGDHDFVVLQQHLLDGFEVLA